MTDSPLLVCSSYGNDSVAAIQLLREREFEDVYILYNDTGWSEPGWNDRVSKLEHLAQSFGYKPFRTTSIGMEALVTKKKGWPRQGMQFCTKELKIEPTIRWLDAVDPTLDFTIVIGKRREESVNRANTPEFVTDNWNYNRRLVWHPLYLHDTEQRDALIRRAGLEPLPHRSKECGICVNEKRDGLRAASEATIANIERIEKNLGFTSNDKPRTMFRPYRHMGATGIREIVRWARSEHGEFNPDDGTGEDCDDGLCG